MMLEKRAQTSFLYSKQAVVNIFYKRWKTKEALSMGVLILIPSLFYK